ncbi:MAG: tetratricopeptide repeat protein [Verrucomicrobiota bacterium]
MNLSELTQKFNAGDIDSKWQLAFYYLQNPTPEFSEKDALKLCRTEAKKGHWQFHVILGWWYFVPDPKKAILWLQEPARQGDVWSQIKLGLLYSSENHPIQDYKAAYWLQRAADQGEPRAQSLLGTLYRRGQGVVKDIRTSLKWYHLAAEQGDECAQGFLGILYGGGYEVAQNLDESLKWHRLSAAQGNEISIKVLQELEFPANTDQKPF